jgi:hypothetical protein
MHACEKKYLLHIPLPDTNHPFVNRQSKGRQFHFPLLPLLILDKKNN